MVERFLSSDDPIKEEDLEWTIKKDASDAKKLLEWLVDTSSYREKQAMIDLIQGLVDELKISIEMLTDLQ